VCVCERERERERDLIILVLYTVQRQFAHVFSSSFQKKELKNNSTAGVILSDVSLILQGLTRYSAGDYTCLAVNSEGKTESNSVSLQIMCKSTSRKLTSPRV